MTATGIDITVLGPVELYAGGAPVALGPPRHRFVFGVLALEANRIVPVHRLLALIWPDPPPRTAVHAVRVAVSRLRAALHESGHRELRIATRGDGYSLLADPHRVDAGRFLAEVEAARACGDPRRRVALLTAALALWTGTPLAGTATAETREPLGRDLERVRSAARRELIDARLAAGEHERLVPELERLSGDHPHDEPVHLQLMLALYRSGRQADALAVCRRLRRALDTDLAIEPGPAVRDLERAILRQDPAVLRPPAVAALPAVARPPGVAALPVRPAQIPPALPSFTGREAELAALDAGRSGIVVVSGTAGVGKTTVAVHWAHRAAGRYPDGQLYVNLRGFDPAAAPLDPASAVRGFLDALSVPAGQVPRTLDGQTALYRSILGDRRVLVVLDNAASADQVRPLLPAGPHCRTVVTSRDGLAPLIAVEGATPVPLDLPSDTAARELLARRLGPDRVAAEPVAVGEIVARCARLPLALAVVAARAAIRPRAGLAAIAGELGDLDTLRAGDASTDVRAAFLWSYRVLSAPAARLFRLLGHHPGPDLTAAAAASLTGGEVRQPLDELVAANLVDEHAPGRYTLHDLLRAFAAEQGERTDAPAARVAASTRLLDHYLHAAHAAAVALDPQRDVVPLASAHAGVVPEPVGADPLDWFDAEHQVLLAAVVHASRHGFDAHVWRIAWTLADVLERRGHWPEFAATQRAALAAARRADDPAEQARAHRTLARAYLRLRRLPDARRHLADAADLARAHGDTAGQAHAHLNLAEVAARGGDDGCALAHALHARDLFEAAGHRPGLGLALNAVGWFQARVGRYPQAVDACTRALTLMCETGDRAGEAATWDSLGYAHRHGGEPARAVDCYRRAVRLYHDLGDRYEEATSLTNLGDTQPAGPARDAWTRALLILDDLGHPDAAEVRDRLRTTERLASTGS